MTWRFKITARHAASAVAVLASVYFTFSQMSNDRRRQQRDLEVDAAVLSESLRAAIEPLARANDRRGLDELAQQFAGRGHLAGLAVYDGRGALLAATKSLRPRLTAPLEPVSRCLGGHRDANAYVQLGGARMRVNVVPLRGGAAAALAVFHGTAYIDNREQRARLDSARRLAIQASLFLAAVWLFGFLIKQPG